MDFISLIVGCVSIILAICAIVFSKKEHARSEENYRYTKEFLMKIEAKTELIDRSVQLQQSQLITIINKALDKIGQSPVDLEPISLEEIDALFDSDLDLKETCPKEESS